MPSHQEIQAAVDLAIQHVLQNGLDDIVKPPTFLQSIETEVIKLNEDDFREEANKATLSFLRSADLRKKSIGNPQYFMVPRDQHTLRRVAWIDPFDLVKYLSLSILLFPQIEAHRPAKNLSVVHSHRRSDNSNTLFDGEFGYDSFRRSSSERSKTRLGGWKVITDISNFFDRIGNHPLKNYLVDCECDPKMTDLVCEILFQWSGDRRSFGVPVGSDASRILSEAALIGVDRQLAETGIEFIRYVDDFRIFAESRHQAYDAVRVLSELLAEEGLNLNNKKTRIFEIRDLVETQEFEEREINTEHSKIDMDERVLIKRRVQISGRSSISRFYRHPGREALQRLSAISVEKIIEDVRQTQGAEQEDAIRDATKYFVYVRQDVEILEVLIEQKITSVFYVVDALVKDADKIDLNVRELARDVLLSGLGADNCSYPFQIPLLRLCSTVGYEDGTLVNAVVSKHRQVDNPFFFREALLLGFQQMHRPVMRRLVKDVFPNVSPALQRAILFALENYERMSEEQKRPLSKNLRQSSSDWFVQRI